MHISSAWSLKAGWLIVLPYCEWEKIPFTLWIVYILTQTHCFPKARLDVDA